MARAGHPGVELTCSKAVDQLGDRHLVSVQADAADVLRTKHARLTNDLDTWEELSRSTNLDSATS